MVAFIESVSSDSAAEMLHPNSGEKPSPFPTFDDHQSTEFEIRAESISKNRCSIHEPQPTEEISIVGELAQLRRRLLDLENAHHRCVEEEKRRAEELFDRRARDRFRQDLRDLRDEPFGMVPIFESTWHGSAYVAAAWSEIAASLVPGGPGPTFEMVRAVILAAGSPWQADRVRAAPARIMACALKATHEPESMLAAWIAGSPAEHRRDAEQRARWHMSQVSDSEAARQELAEKADAEKYRWSLLSDASRIEYEKARASAADRAVGIGMGDKALADELRILNRYLTMTRNRIDKLERRLEALSEQRSHTKSKKRKMESGGACPEASRYDAATCELQPASEPRSTDGIPQPSGVSTETTPLKDEATSSDKIDEPAEIENYERIDRTDKVRDMQRVRHIDWGDSKQVRREDLLLMAKLVRMPPSLQRDALIRMTFGTESHFRRCLKMLRKWAKE